MLKRAFKQITPLPILERLAGRTRRAYALGPPKSGTTSVARVFADVCRSRHEPERPATVESMHAHFVGDISDDELKRTYKARDKQLLLDVESNCFLAYRPDLLKSVYPDAKFVVLLREPRSWLDSIFDNNINFPRTKTPTMTKWHSVFFHGDSLPETTSDRVLANIGLYPLHWYLEYWQRTYERCLRALQGDMCLRVGTNQIGRRLGEIAEHIGLEPVRIDGSDAHRNKTASKHGILEQLEIADVDEAIERICHPLIERYELAALWR